MVSEMESQRTAYRTIGKDPRGLEGGYSEHTKDEIN
jgi:hypothetical protein